MPTVCRLLAAVILAGFLAWVGAAAAALYAPDWEGTAVVAPGWLLVALFAARRARGRPGRFVRRAGCALTAVVPAGCALWFLFLNGLPQGAAAVIIVGWWAYVACAGVLGLALDGDPRPAAAWDDNE